MPQPERKQAPKEFKQMPQQEIKPVAPQQRPEPRVAPQQPAPQRQVPIRQRPRE